jgi:phage tail-like protein
VADARRDPYRNFRFRIKWDGRYVAGVSRVSPLVRTAEVIEVRQGSDPASSQKLPGRISFAPIALERGITRDREFEKWADAVTGASGGTGAVNFRKDIVIEVYNERGQLALAYLVHRAWVSEYQALPELDAHGHAIAIEHIVLQHDGWERDTTVVEPADLGLAALVPLDTAVRLAGLARRIEPQASRDDLFLPPAQQNTLTRITDHIRQRQTVLGEWGLAGVFRTPGVTALFVGARGTGKTMAAEAIASELALDLYRVDLSALVSRYVGETEKNIDRVFNAAEGTGTILLFDEADALFGKRTKVKDSHDRYANIEVAYLLNRLEDYDGIAILSSNLRETLDDDILRRFRFVVEFPLPDASVREAIWRRVFPEKTPIERLDYRKLAQLKLTGGAIRRVATDAAFLAAAAGTKVTMGHVLEAARSR